MSNDYQTHEPDRRRNVELEKVLAQAGWGVRKLADEINKAAIHLHTGTVTVHRRHANRWITPDKARDRPSVPRPPFPGLACEVLSLHLGEPLTPAQLGWPDADPHVERHYAQADDGLNQPWTARGALDCLAQVVDPGAVERRYFLALTGASLTTIAHQWLFDPARVTASLRGDRVTDALVTDFEQVADGVRRMDDKIGGGTLLPIIQANLRLVSALLGNSSYTEAVGRRLHGLAAEFGRMAGWVAYDIGDEAAAQRYWIAALRNAHVSGDRAIGANILAFMSIAASNSKRPQDGVDLARSALQAERELTPAVAASLNIRLARNAAGVGDTYTAQKSLDRAAQHLRRSDPGEEPAWIYWFNQAAFEGDAGRSALLLGRFTEAEGHLRNCVALIGSDFDRDRSFYLCNLATARLGIGSVEHACSTANEAAISIRRTNSKHNQCLTEFRQALAPYSTAAVVREFDEKHRDLFTVST
jgi:tetratricopeptide (TPR) repeat protein